MRNKHPLLFTALFLLISQSLFSQYYVSYPILLPDDYYSSGRFTYFDFMFQRPNDSYSTIRLRGLGEGFNGLIPDSLSDGLRNPALLSNLRSQVYGDWGSNNDFGKFTLGGITTSSEGTFGIFASLARLSKEGRKSEYNEPGNNQRNSSNDINKGPDEAGGQILFSKKLTDALQIGFRYSYLHKKYESNYHTLTENYNPVGNKSENFDDEKIISNLHDATAGIAVTLDEDLLDLKLRAYTSDANPVGDDYYRHTYSSPQYYDTHFNSSDANITQTTGSLSAVYIMNSVEQHEIRFVADIAYTTYEAEGDFAYKYEYGYVDSVVLSGSYQNGKIKNRGHIFDLRLGAGNTHRITDDVSLYSGVYINYIRNVLTSDAISNSGNSNQTTPTTNTASANNDEILKGYDIRFPLAAEINLNDYLQFRLGIEPRYRDGEADGRGIESSSDSYFLSYVSYNTTFIERNGLSFNVNSGASFQWNNIVKAHILFGSDLSYIYQWKFSVEYFFE